MSGRQAFNPVATKKHFVACTNHTLHAYSVQLSKASALPSGLIKLPAVAAASVAVSASGGGFLGRYTKSSTPPPPIGDLDPEVLALKRGNRVERYRLLSAARAVFVRAGAAKGLMYPHDFHRTSKCSYISRGVVQVHHAAEFNGAFYSGLIACGCVWTCPVCSTKIQERRREEIALGIDWAIKSKFQPIMVTFTFPHRAFHKISDLLERQKLAFEYLRSGNRFTKFVKKFGYEGLIRSLELMYGDNGWHPHTHEMWFVRGDVDASEIHAEILRIWTASCIKAGLLDETDADSMRAFSIHAVDVKGHCRASDYLAKMDDAKHWGADRELAKGTKKASKSGVHPFGLLDRAHQGDLRAKRLFLAYAIAIKGKAQIYWSPGLKKRVGIGEKTDEALAEEQREEADILGQIEPEDWRNVRRSEQRAQLLTAAEKGGWPAVVDLISTLRVQAPAPKKLVWIDADGVIYSHVNPLGVDSAVQARQWADG